MIDFNKPLETNVPEEIAIALPVTFAGRKLVQITEENGSAGLYLASKDGYIHRLTVDATDAGPVLRNVRQAVDVPEFFLNVFDNGATGFQHRTLAEANHAATSGPQPFARRACIGIKILVNSNNLVHTSVRTFPI